MLPTEVMEEVQQEMLDYQGHGASIIEIITAPHLFWRFWKKPKSFSATDRVGFEPCHVFHALAELRCNSLPFR